MLGRSNFLNQIYKLNDVAIDDWIIIKCRLTCLFLIGDTSFGLQFSFKKIGF